MNLKFKVISDSMLPLIPIGAELSFIEKSTGLNTFDIILFRRDEKLVVHYIWRNQYELNKSFITRSLKNIYKDEYPIEYSEILGQVRNFKIPLFTKIKILLLCLVKGEL